MNIKLNKADKDKFFKLLDIKEENIEAANIYLELITYHSRDFKEKELKNKSSFDLIFDSLNLDKEDEIFLNMKKDYFGNNLFNVADYDYFLNNEYLKNIKPQPFKFKKYQLSYEYYYANELFILDDIKVNKDDYFKEKTSIAYFKKDFPYLALKENNIIWMAITPNEILTMKDNIEIVNGNLLVLGLGLGYFPYMAALKENVKKITIIEKDLNIINIFNEHIYPLFKKEIKDKITLINDDAILYINETDLNNFNFVFSDLWHSVDDGFSLYLKIKDYERKYKNTKFLYWLIDGLKQMEIRCKLSLLYEQFNNFDESNYLKIDNAIDEYINNLYFQTKEKSIISYQEIIDFLNQN